MIAFEAIWKDRRPAWKGGGMESGVGRSVRERGSKRVLCARATIQRRQWLCVQVTSSYGKMFALAFTLTVSV